MDFIHGFRQRGWVISVASASLETERMATLDLPGVEKTRVELNHSSFDQFLLDLNPQIVLFDRFHTEEQFGWRVDLHAPESLRILDTVDLHCLRKARRQAQRENRELHKRDYFSDTAKREIAAIWRSDLTLLTSFVEKNLLREIFEVSAPLWVHPLLVDPNQWSRQPSRRLAFEDRQHFVHIGNFRHPPNLDAVHYLHQILWPSIRQALPNAELHLYGAYPKSSTMGLQDLSKGFLVKGPVEDARATIGEARVMLAPLRFGAGQKGKLLDAMVSGTPSVTTSVGAEAMHLETPWGGAIEDDPAGFVQSAVNLYTNGTSWEIAQGRGDLLVQELFLSVEHENSLHREVDRILEDLKTHRSRHFTSALLRHQTLRSTEYFARWIEAKNRSLEISTHRWPQGRRMSFFLGIKVIFLVASILVLGSILFHTLRLGISPMPSSHRAVAAMLGAMPPKPEEIVELGAGWGTLLVAAAKAFPQARISGYEISLVPLLVSRLRFLLRGPKVALHRQDFRTAVLPKRGVVLCFLFPEGMRWVQKLIASQEFEELWLISHTFALPDATPEQILQLNDRYRSPIYLYLFRWMNFRLTC